MMLAWHILARLMSAILRVSLNGAEARQLMALTSGTQQLSVLPEKGIPTQKSDLYEAGKKWHTSISL